MASDRDLSVNDQLVLLASLRLGPKAYGVTIHREIELTARKAPVVATIYVTLDRLVSRGYLVTRQGDPTPERGGRSKVYFTVTAAGHQALAESLSRIDALRGQTAYAGRMA